MTAVDPPELLTGAPSVLGALGPGLRRLAELQGGWPPRPASHPRTPAPAGSREEGLALADAAADEGVDLLVVEADGDPVPALAALAVLLDLEPVHALGTAGGPGWAGQVAAVRTALPRLRPLVGDPAALLEAWQAARRVVLVA
ncbi:MAG: Nicotinate-nucleotide--dimethylbenzimidazole phosphoribosyltransferase, partial [Frankiales bacterium]|nr:Nicotinate-nucleotide--dimethylbenzimidazole phosphoribosyltransferase [Frankiales bacterium]